MQDHDKNLLLAGAKGIRVPARAMVDEAHACLYGLRCAYDHGFRNITIKGNFLQMIQMLKTKLIHDSLLCFLVKDILAFLIYFDFYSMSFVKRDGHKVAHDLAHRQSLYLEGRLWESKVPKDILT